MQLIESSYEIIDYTHGAIQKCGKIAKVAYQSENDVTDSFIKFLKRRKHLSVFEHSIMTVSFIVDRGVTHELVRHRIASFTQESTRYCTYDKHVRFIRPDWLTLPVGEYNNVGRKGKDDSLFYVNSLICAEKNYKEMLKRGHPAQLARDLLPTCTAAQIVVTANLREWLHIFKLRNDKAAHPAMRKMMKPLQNDCAKLFSPLFVRSR